MNAIVARTDLAHGNRPAVQSRQFSDLVGKFTNRLEDTGDFRRKCISGMAAPRDEEREALEARKAELMASMEPTPDEARKVLVSLLGAFPSFGEDEETARFILAACCRACAKVPTWALRDAAARFLEGRARVQWNMATRLTPPQILAEALQGCLEVESELNRINVILDAEVVDTETTDLERQEAMDAWAKLKAEMGRSNIISERTPEEVSRERAAMAEANRRVRAREARGMDV